MDNLGPSQLADQSGVKLSTIRYYERCGILAEPRRSAAGYRRYPADAVDRIRFVRHAQALGFSLAEARQLLTLWGGGHGHHDCASVSRRAEKKLADVDRRIAALGQLRTTLAELVRQCHCQDGKDGLCPLLQRLEASDADHELPHDPQRK